jgi:hypothetical protein
VVTAIVRPVTRHILATTMASAPGAMAMAPMAGAVAAVAMAGAIAMVAIVPMAGPAADPTLLTRNSRRPRRLTGWRSAGANYDWSPFPQEIG